MRQLIGWILTMLICVVVAFNVAAFLIVSVQNILKCQRIRKEKIRSMEDRVVRLRPLPLEIEKSEDVTIANNDESNAGGPYEENKENDFLNDNQIQKIYYFGK